jgi:hypothetical protein
MESWRSNYVRHEVLESAVHRRIWLLEEIYLYGKDSKKTTDTNTKSVRATWESDVEDPLTTTIGWQRTKRHTQRC